MGVVEAIYENGVFKPLKKLNLPEKRRVKLIILDEFIRDLDDAFGILEADIDLEKLRKEWDRDVSP
ncbi:antitoxin family protein [Thermococcus waiotapuensis]|uniref:Antitoxin n=1 Tax=Thermococcus waiotapuensis TaxID=90909 RepID=A0AAE4T343_9EURY|nr:antitoxin family protein [Thermococcus waiotapuensis]MDV3103356.1 antitoxin family protein [Thermococcus waiotapuensis]